MTARRKADDTAGLAPSDAQSGVSLLNRVHEGYVHARRTRVLTSHLAPLLAPEARVLDVGCGDGLISHLIQTRRPDVSIEGIDVLTREAAWIPVKHFDGYRIPYPDKSFDAVMFVDVLHHATGAKELLAEARRVSRRHVILKDHVLKGILAGRTLRFMDWVGNAHHGVVLPYNYWSEQQWAETFADLRLRTEYRTQRLQLYPRPAGWLFDRDLHFVAQLAVP